MDTLQALAQLRAFVIEQHDEDIPGAWLAERLREYLNGYGAITLDEALGLKPGRGEEPWWALEARVIRDHAIRDLADTFSVASVREQARQVTRSVVRYQQSRWPRDAKCDAVTYRGQRSQALHQLMLATQGDAPNENTVRRVLNVAHEIGDLVSHDSLSNTSTR